jgi:hypothetical protein
VSVATTTWGRLPIADELPSAFRLASSRWARMFRQGTTNSFTQNQLAVPIMALSPSALGGQRGETRATALSLGEQEETRSTALTVADQAVIDRIQHLYTIRGTTEVERALGERPGVASALLEAADWVYVSFQGDTDVVLEVIADPEDEDDAGKLYALIQTDLAPEEARPRMRKFREWWWTDRSINVGEDLNFALEYR